MIHKDQRIHVIYLDFLNNIYPDLNNDLQLFWTRAAHAAQQLHLLTGHAPRTIIHHIQLPCQTNNFDCGIFVLAYQRAAQSWIDQRITTLTTTLRQVNQHTATALRTQLRTSLAPHCKIHLRAPHALSCSTINDACACLTRIRSEPIHIDSPIQTARHSDQPPSQLNEPTRAPAPRPEPPPPEGPHEDTDTDNHTPDMLAQHQHDLTELPKLI